MASRESSMELRNKFSVITYGSQTKVLIVSPLDLLDKELCLAKKEQVQIFVEEFFELLNDKINLDKKEVEVWISRLNRASKELKTAYNLTSESCINLEDAIVLIKNYSHGVFTTGIGNHWYQAGKVIEGKNVTNFFTATCWGSIGVGIPYALGISSALPDSQVIVIEGDGGFYWSLPSILILGREDYKKRNIKIFILRDNSYAAIEQDILKKNSMSRAADLNQYNYVNYKYLCKSLKINYTKANTKKELISVLKRIKNITTPILVEITVKGNMVYELDLNKQYFEFLANSNFNQLNNNPQTLQSSKIC